MSSQFCYSKVYEIPSTWQQNGKVETQGGCYSNQIISVFVTYQLELHVLTVKQVISNGKTKKHKSLNDVIRLLLKSDEAVTLCLKHQQLEQ